MALLSAADFDDILLLLSPDLTQEDIPPRILASNAFLWSAEQEVKALDTAAETRTGDAYIGVCQAARCFAAARLASTLTDLTEERFPVYAVKLTNPNREKQAENLRLDAYRYIAAAMGVSLVDLITGNLDGNGRMIAFDVASGTNGEIPF